MSKKKNTTQILLYDTLHITIKGDNELMPTGPKTVRNGDVVRILVLGSIIDLEFDICNIEDDKEITKNLANINIKVIDTKE